MRIGRYRQAEADRKKYVVDYNDWLSISELLTVGWVTPPTNSDGFFVDGYAISEDRRSLVFYVSGGKAGEEYDTTVKIQTSDSQIKEDWVTFVVT